MVSSNFIHYMQLLQGVDQVPFLRFESASVLSALANGYRTALVIQRFAITSTYYHQSHWAYTVAALKSCLKYFLSFFSGHQFTSIVPVWEGTALNSLGMLFPIAGEDLHKEVAKESKRKASDRNAGASVDDDDDEGEPSFVQQQAYFTPNLFFRNEGSEQTHLGTAVIKVSLQFPFSPLPISRPFTRFHS